MDIFGVTLARAAYFPSLAFGLFMNRLGRRPWYSKIDNTVILGALPFRSHTQQLVQNENVRAVISMNEDHELHFSNNFEEWRAAGVEFLHLATVDFIGVPTKAQIRQGVDLITKYRQLGLGMVYVHCKAGRTRSATLVACYLMETYGMTASEAVAHLKLRRPHVELKDRHLKALKHYEEQLSASR